MVAAGKYFQIYIKSASTSGNETVKGSKINTMEHYMGLQKHKKKYLFIADDIIELQMFQGCQNWSWISQGVLGSIFIALPGNPGGWEIQLYSMLQ